MWHLWVRRGMHTGYGGGNQFEELGVCASVICKVKGKGKGKDHPRTGHEGPEGE